jgi:hypothetical protein
MVSCLRVGSSVWIFVALIGVAAASPARAEPMPCGIGSMRLDDVGVFTPAQARALRSAPRTVAAEGPFDIVIAATPALQANPAAMQALERAAAAWEAVIRSPITVTIDADLTDIGTRAIAQTQPRVLSLPIAEFNQDLAAVSRREPTDVAAQRLASVAFAADLPPGFTFSGTVLNAKPAFKAIVEGFFDLDAMFGVSDGRIEFSSTRQFDFDNRDGVMPGTFDFESVAIHEIGHALGFLSAVDSIDLAPFPGATPIFALDLYRFPFSAQDLPATPADFDVFRRNLRPGFEAVFDDIDREFRMATGSRSGDGNQTSHWKANERTGIRIGVMDPTIDFQEVIPISTADRRALDLVGYDMQVAEALPDVTILANGAAAPLMKTVVAGTPVAFDGIVADADGLGFPVLARAFGFTPPISVIWDFGGGQLLSEPATVFSLTPVARFDLAPGGLSRVHPVALSAFDTLGDTTRQQVQVIASEPPDAEIRINGMPAQPTTIVSGTNLQFLAVAGDEDGLGFPILAGFGSSTPFSFLWNFGGGQPDSPASVLTIQPGATFTLDRGERERTFLVELSVFDTLGLTTQRSVPITVTNRPPDVRVFSSSVSSGAASSTVQFSSEAADEDGLGFPILAGFGSTAPISYLWNFGGGEGEGPLSVFTPNPRATFTLADGEQERSFGVTLTVFDTLGFSTQVDLAIRVTRMEPMEPMQP